MFISPKNSFVEHNTNVKKKKKMPVELWIVFISYSSEDSEVVKCF